MKKGDMTKPLNKKRINDIQFEARRAAAIQRSQQENRDYAKKCTEKEPIKMKRASCKTCCYRILCDDRLKSEYPCIHYKFDLKTI